MPSPEKTRKRNETFEQAVRRERRQIRQQLALREWLSSEVLSQESEDIVLHLFAADDEFISDIACA